MYNYHMIKTTKKVTVRKIKPAFTDKRGAIIDILEGVPIKHIGLVTFEKGVIRGNHYHKNQIQYSYLLEGEIKLVTKDVSSGKIYTKITKPGELVSIPAGVIHTYVATKKSSMVVLTDFSRDFKSYEADTARVQLVK